MLQIRFLQGSQWVSVNVLKTVRQIGALTQRSNTNRHVDCIIAGLHCGWVQLIASAAIGAFIVQMGLRRTHNVYCHSCLRLASGLLRTLGHTLLFFHQGTPLPGGFVRCVLIGMY